jgi:hypothetical protein
MHGLAALVAVVTARSRFMHLFSNEHFAASPADEKTRGAVLSNIQPI